MNFEELSEDLRGVAEDRVRREKLLRERERVVAQVAQLERRRERWEDLVAESHEDLGKLEGMSLTALFRTILGDREDRIEEERKKLLHAKLQHDEADAALAPSLADLARIDQELRSLNDLGTREAELLAAKEHLLQARGGEQAASIERSAEAIAKLQNLARELDEAIDAGRQAAGSLGEAIDHLGGARSWGTFDMFGGGLIATMAKHSRIDKARLHAERAQQHLRRFARELEDVAEQGSELRVELDGFLRFADYFFDGLLFDWLVQRRIVEALERVQEAQRRVRTQLFDLERRAKATREELAAAQQARTQWIAGAE